MEFEMIAKTFQGLEEVLAAELIAIGANNVEIQRRAVSFTGDKAMMYKANMQLRTATRILKPILSFKAKDADAVYAELKKFNWEEHMNVNSSFAIDATVFSEEFLNSRFVTYKVKDAIVDWFRERYEKRPSVRIDNPQLLFNIHIAQNRCTLSLDSSGESLHKRGYRVVQNDAPINEALAAGMLLLAGWKGDTDFLDPLCGSGTLLIEAALIALNIPPGIYRPSFGFEKWTDFDEELFQSIYNDDSGEREFKHKIYGSDISPRAIKLAEDNIKSAGLAKHIVLNTVSVKDVNPPSDKCLLVTNPPYGERLLTNDILALYANIGSTLKHKFMGCKAWIISSNEDCIAQIGLKPSVKIPLMNGPLECSFNCYEIFSGKRDEYIRLKKKA